MASATLTRNLIRAAEAAAQDHIVKNMVITETRKQDRIRVVISIPTWKSWSEGFIKGIELFDKYTRN
jgi:hypothetical protein